MSMFFSAVKAVLRPATAAPLSSYAHHHVMYAPRYLCPTTTTNIPRLLPLPSPPKTMYGWMVEKFGDAVMRDGELYVDAEGDETIPTRNAEKEFEGEPIEISVEKVFGIQEMLRDLPTLTATASSIQDAFGSASHASMASTSTHTGHTQGAVPPTQSIQAPTAPTMGLTKHVPAVDGTVPPTQVATANAPVATTALTTATNTSATASQPAPATTPAANFPPMQFSANPASTMPDFALAAMTGAQGSQSKRRKYGPFGWRSRAKPMVGRVVSPCEIWGNELLKDAIEFVENTPYVDEGDASKASIEPTEVGETLRACPNLLYTPRYVPGPGVPLPTFEGGRAVTTMTTTAATISTPTTTTMATTAATAPTPRQTGDLAAPSGLQATADASADASTTAITVATTAKASVDLITAAHHTITYGNTTLYPASIQQTGQPIMGDMIGVPVHVKQDATKAMSFGASPSALGLSFGPAAAAFTAMPAQSHITAALQESESAEARALRKGKGRVPEYCHTGLTPPTAYAVLPSAAAVNSASTTTATLGPITPQDNGTPSLPKAVSVRRAFSGFYDEEDEETAGAESAQPLAARKREYEGVREATKREEGGDESDAESDAGSEQGKAVSQADDDSGVVNLTYLHKAKSITLSTSDYGHINLFFLPEEIRDDPVGCAWEHERIMKATVEDLFDEIERDLGEMLGEEVADLELEFAGVPGVMTRGDEVTDGLRLTAWLDTCLEITDSDTLVIKAPWGQTAPTASSDTSSTPDTNGEDGAEASAPSAEDNSEEEDEQRAAVRQALADLKQITLSLPDGIRRTLFGGSEPAEPHTIWFSGERDAYASGTVDEILAGVASQVCEEWEFDVLSGLKLEVKGVTTLEPGSEYGETDFAHFLVASLDKLNTPDIDIRVTWDHQKSLRKAPPPPPPKPVGTSRPQNTKARGKATPLPSLASSGSGARLAAAIAQAQEEHRVLAAGKRERDEDYDEAGVDEDERMHGTSALRG
ncbi:hypothetical protein IAT38_003019 [Cryptococcus sp. DSM 104549]